MGPDPNAVDPFPLDIDALLHPAQAFTHPNEVVNDPDLTVNEKRAILASWASDASAVEAAPALRQVPGSANIVTIDEILEALRELDKIARAGAGEAVKRKARRLSFVAFKERRAS